MHFLVFLMRKSSGTHHIYQIENFLSVEKTYIWIKRWLHVVCQKPQYRAHCSFYFISTKCRRLRLVNYYYMPIILVCSLTERYKKNKGTSKSRFLTLTDCFIDNKLRVHFGENKKKQFSFLQSADQEMDQLDISYKDVKIKQCSLVTYHKYVSCMKAKQGESMAIRYAPKLSQNWSFYTEKTGTCRNT